MQVARRRVNKRGVLEAGSRMQGTQWAGSHNSTQPACRRTAARLLMSQGAGSSNGGWGPVGSAHGPLPVEHQAPGNAATTAQLQRQHPAHLEAPALDKRAGRRERPCAPGNIDRCHPPTRRPLESCTGQLLGLAPTAGWWGGWPSPMPSRPPQAPAAHGPRPAPDRP